MEKYAWGQTTPFRVLAECNFCFETSDYHMIKQPDIMTRSPFCIVSLHVEHRKPYSPVSELCSTTTVPMAHSRDALREVLDPSYVDRAIGVWRGQ